MQQPIYSYTYQPPQAPAFAIQPLPSTGYRFPSIPAQTTAATPASQSELQPMFLTPSAALSYPKPASRPLAVDIGLTSRPSSAFAESDMKVLMLLAAQSHKQQCERSVWSSGRAWLWLLIILILIVIIVWIIIAVSSRRRKQNRNCDGCGNEQDHCRCKRRHHKKSSESEEEAEHDDTTKED
jgi:hypothetical protein